MTTKVAFIGCGSWGAALGQVLAEKDVPITMWHRDSKIVKKMCTTRKHYLIPSLSIHNDITITSQLSNALNDADIVVLAIPSQSIRSLLRTTKSFLRNSSYIVNVAKGIENGTLMTMSEVIYDELHILPKVVTLSGPSHAEEVIEGHPTTLVSASSDSQSAQYVQQLFSNDRLRVYTSKDIRGVELGGSIKNVVAIAAGFCDGTGYGDNTKAALMTRGIKEISRLGLHLGAKPDTFSGLSGIGDLIVTCSSKYSRNRKVGEEIGRGEILENILAGTHMIPEGVQTALSVHQLSKKVNIEMPICEAVYNVLFKKENPQKSVHSLMTRDLKPEYLE